LTRLVGADDVVGNGRDGRGRGRRWTQCLEWMDGSHPAILAGGSGAARMPTGDGTLTLLSAILRRRHPVSTTTGLRPARWLRAGVPCRRGTERRKREASAVSDRRAAAIFELRAGSRTR